jgi:hypothetical protein
MQRIVLESLVGFVDKQTALLVRPDGETIAEIEAPTIVAVLPPVPDLALTAALDGLGLPYRIVGDALAPRTAWQAFTEGMVAGAAL